MKPLCKSRILFLALALCIIFSVVFTENLSAGSNEHDCTGADCPICLIIEAGQNFLKTLKITGFLFFTALMAFLAHILIGYSGLNAYTLSPIKLKIRINS